MKFKTELFQISSERISDDYEIVKEMFNWQGFKVYVTSKCRVLFDSPDTEDCPKYTELDEGVIEVINLVSDECHACHNLVFTSNEDYRLESVFETLYPFSDRSDCKVLINGE